MQPIKSFVVRIYRQDRDSIAGLVEDVRTGRSRPFRTLGGLWAALTRRWSRRGAEAADEASPALEETQS